MEKSIISLGQLWKGHRVDLLHSDPLNTPSKTLRTTQAGSEVS